MVSEKKKKNHIRTGDGKRTHIALIKHRRSLSYASPPARAHRTENCSRKTCPLQAKLFDTYGHTACRVHKNKKLQANQVFRLG